MFLFCSQRKSKKDPDPEGWIGALGARETIRSLPTMRDERR